MTAPAPNILGSLLDLKLVVPLEGLSDSFLVSLKIFAGPVPVWTIELNQEYYC
jgi:hypothetical protein